MTSVASFGSSTHTGKVRKHNEDSLGVFPEQGLYVVADGMGGRAGGDVASQIAVDTVGRVMDSSISLCDAIVEADRTISRAPLSGEGRSGMGTTVVALQLTADQFNIAWVGDSRVYRINQGIHQLSHDHSVVQELIDRGAIDKSESRTHPRRNVITRALGNIQGDPDKVDEVTGSLSEKEVFVLCTDGLHGLVPDAVIEKIVSSHTDPQQAADVLMQAALDAGGRDNISVIVVKSGSEQSS